VNGDPNRDAPVQETLSVSIPKSDWASKLRQAGALDILFLEIPMPVAGGSVPQTRAVEHLRAAQRHFVDGNYRACIAECREVLDALGATTGALKALSSDQREGMDKAQREAAMMAAIRHYTHPAHHSATLPLQTGFTRSEAKFLLQLTAACVGFGNGMQTV
jgi:hypothetical protein